MIDEPVERRLVGFDMDLAAAPHPKVARRLQGELRRRDIP